ncbi:MAG: CDP-diacylglycerol--glycerol-3-phosphate 3-phosphatidyltransferase [Methylococcus sp.]|nr:MAG: CDP-diacylglycerol--glycerol-3-phosphate 3-phosphatidyltransferase [Methylococcus sp.]
MDLNLPTNLTLIRIAMIPLLVVIFYMPWEASHAISALIFVVAACTDFFDGYLARKMDQVTKFGAFLDPVADKLMVAVVLVLIVQSEPSPYLAIPAAVIIGREITIASLREWMAELGIRSHIEVSWFGKLKTSAQMAAIASLLYQDEILGISMRVVGYVLLYLAVILTLWSMMNYLRAAWPAFIKHR